MPDRIIKGKQGRYKLIDVRGSGSMATVYVAAIWTVTAFLQ
jgi:hypothetical protein